MQQRSIRRTITHTTGIYLMLLSTLSFAGDITAGKTKADGCVGCHGPQGIALAPNFPNLAGQKEKYLQMAIKKYRDGGRNDPIMKAMTLSLSDEDIANLAAYFSSLASK